MKVVFCLPGKTWSHVFLSGWNRLLIECAQRQIEVTVSTAYSASVAEARNGVLHGDIKKPQDQLPFNGELDYDYMIWLDSDISFQADQIFKMLSHEKDIVSGYYKMQSGKFPMIEEFPEDFTKTGWGFMDEEEMAKRKAMRTGLFKVKFNGFGFFCIKKGVFESMEFPWFRHNWYSFENPMMSKFQLSEDISWCFNAIEKGYDIWCDPELRVGHHKDYVV